MLAFYMSDSQNVRFQLVEFESDKNVKSIGKSKEISAVAGINKLKLPIDYPELTVGKKYFWQITLDCEGENSISRRAEFDVVPQSFAKTRFSTIPESVKYYAENDLWYEALEEALKQTANGKLSQSGSILLKQLARVEAPINTETKDKIEIINKQIEYLQKISDIRL